MLQKDLKIVNMFTVKFFENLKCAEINTFTAKSFTSFKICKNYFKTILQFVKRFIAICLS